MNNYQEFARENIINMNPNSDTSIEDTTLKITVDGQSKCFEFGDLKKFHQGDSWFGCAVGFRVMQIAARELSNTTLWSREDLYIVSGHPGEGVKDAIELITSTVSSNHFRLLDNVPSQGCSKRMKFEWWISDGKQTLHIKMNNNVVPEQFFTKLDQLSNDDALTDDERGSKHKEFDKLKTDLSNDVWDRPLNANFMFDFLSSPLKAGELPDE
ncbi:MAG: hypothetical protein DRQ44_01190 [Gammaproteobacteria bacterium]|nr:MAG: hypothetical protein DRQ44_01190 [Gammaproteobacteria bacterium]